MLMRMRTLALAILCSMAPVSGAQVPAVAEPMRRDGECPYAHAAAAAAEREAAPGATIRWAARPSDGMSVFDTGGASILAF
jgi:hypothetical protein